MRELKLKKEELLEILRKNQENHKKDFERAWNAYVEHERLRLEQLYSRAKTGQTVHRSIVDLANEPIPKNYSREYDRVIRAVELHDDTHFMLNEQEFAMYVQDDWRWKREFVTTSANYGTASAADIDYYEISE